MSTNYNMGSSSSQLEKLEKMEAMMKSIIEENQSLKAKLEDVENKVSQFDDLRKEVKAFQKLKREFASVKAEVKRLSGSHSPLSIVNEEEHSEASNQNPEIEEDASDIEQVVFAVDEKIYDDENKSRASDENEKNLQLQNPPERWFQKYASIRKSLGLQHSCDVEVYNTGTIYLLATSIAYQTGCNPTRRSRILVWATALSSVIFQFGQVFLLVMLTSAADNPTCTKHSDCRPGQLCYGFENETWRQPRCRACSTLETSEISCSNERLMDPQIASGVNLGYYFESSWFDSDHTSQVNIQADDLSAIFTSEEEAMICIAEQYCEENTPTGFDVTSKGCPFVEMFMKKSSFSGFVVLFVMSILFSTYLFKDMQEALVENSLLEFTISSETSNCLSLALFIVRITNRARLYWLPHYTAMAAASIILSDDLSPKNVTLNLLALIFIIEADNLVASLIFSARQQEKAEELVQLAKANNIHVNDTVIKRYSVIIALCMFFSCFYIEVLLRYLSSDACGIFFALSATFIFILPHLVMFCKFVADLIFGKKTKKLTRAVLAYLWMYIAAYMMGLMFSISRFSVAADLFSIIPPVPLIVSVVSSLCVVARPRQMIEDSYEHSRKDSIINLILASAWCAVQFWSMQRVLAVTGLL